MICIEMKRNGIVVWWQFSRHKFFFRIMYECLYTLWIESYFKFNTCFLMFLKTAISFHWPLSVSYGIGIQLENYWQSIILITNEGRFWNWIYQSSWHRYQHVNQTLVNFKQNKYNDKVECVLRSEEKKLSN